MANVKVLTLNCWGIWLLSSERKERISAIASFIASKDYDIVLLQEVWCDEDFTMIKSMVKHMPYNHFFYTGAIGSGTCILSKHKISEASFHEYSLNGNPQDILHGDWYAGKGLGVCRMKINNLNVCVFVTHLHAEYLSTREAYLAHRVSQALEAGVWIKLCAAGADLVIVGGDFNSEPGDIPHDALKAIVPLQDAWISAKADGNGESCGALKNSYTNLHTILPGSCSFKPSERTLIPTGQRIDFIMFRSNGKFSSKAMSCEQPLPDRVPGTTFSYSDHEGVSATIKVEQRGGEAQDAETCKYDTNNSMEMVLKKSKQILNDRLNQSSRDQIFYFLLAGFLWTLMFALIFSSFSGWFLGTLEAICCVAATVYTLIAGVHLKKEQNALKAALQSLLILEQSK